METLPERIPPPEVSEAWIRECLRVHPEGVLLTVSGTCMEPALKEGARIELRSPTSPPRVGDVVLLRLPAGLRLHRVLFRWRDRIRTKGDQGMYLDPATSADAVVALWLPNEAAPFRFLRVSWSLIRLFFRPFRPAAVTPGDGDGEHARLLP
jgi:hypothetical protein